MEIVDEIPLHQTKQAFVAASLGGGSGRLRALGCMHQNGGPRGSPLEVGQIGKHLTFKIGPFYD